MSTSKRLAAIINKSPQEIERLNPAAFRAKPSHLWHVYRLTEEQYNELWHKQDGKCAICLSLCTSGKALHVDHSHTTGKVRGLLCKRCNMTLGLLNDDTVILQRAIVYLGV
jgi:hypothetical protein